MSDLIDRQSLLAQIEMAEQGARFDTQRALNGEERMYPRWNIDTLKAMINDMPSVSICPNDCVYEGACLYCQRNSRLCDCYIPDKEE